MYVNQSVFLSITATPIPPPPFWQALALWPPQLVFLGSILPQYMALSVSQFCQKKNLGHFEAR